MLDTITKLLLDGTTLIIEGFLRLLTAYPLGIVLASAALALMLILILIAIPGKRPRKQPLKVERRKIIQTRDPRSTTDETPMQAQEILNLLNEIVGRLERIEQHLESQTSRTPARETTPESTPPTPAGKARSPSNRTASKAKRATQEAPKTPSIDRERLDELIKAHERRLRSNASPPSPHDTPGARDK